MGNAEARALAASDHSIIVDAVLQEHREFLTAADRAHYLDRAQFGLFFDVEKSAVPFRLIDQLYDSANLASKTTEESEEGAGTSSSGSGGGGLRFSQVVLPLMLAMPTVPLSDKLRMVFQAADPTRGTQADVQVAALSKSLQALVMVGVQRLRGHRTHTAGGTLVTEFHDRRCQGCGEVPTNVAFECRDCFNGHTVLGLPVTTHLCHNCVGSWNGISLCYEMRHEPLHRMDQVHRVANPHTLTHPGVSCSGCGMCPITGPRYQCLECIDLVDLCEECNTTSESPLGHANHHRAVVHDRRALTLEQEVQQLVTRLFTDGGLMPESASDDGFNQVKALIPIEHTLPRDNREILLLPSSSPVGATSDAKTKSKHQLLSDGVVEPLMAVDPRYVREAGFVASMLQSEQVISLLTGFDVRHVKLCPYPESLIQTSQTGNVGS